MKYTASLLLIALLLMFDFSYAIDSFAPIVKKVIPSVVNVYSEKSSSNLAPFEDTLLERFFGYEGRVKSLGSGIIITSNGMIATNDHVVSNSKDIKVVLYNGKEFSASIVAVEKSSDLALLKIDEDIDGLPFLNFGNSDEIEVGDQVLAIGNPFGLGQTVTSGIVSALSRSGIGALSYNSFIQTDAAINPGNSGGALIDTKGNLIGINTAIMTKTGEYAGIGFAIPVNMLRTLTNNMKFTENGVFIERPWTGIIAQNITQEIASSINIDSLNGAIVKKIYNPSPAHDAGIEIGDIILKVDGISIKDNADLNYRIATSTMGDVIPIEIQRNGKIISVNLKLQSAPEIPSRDRVVISGEGVLDGIRMENISVAVKSEMGIESNIEGVIVTESKNRLSVELLKGDMILYINNSKITSTSDVYNVISSNINRTNWKFVIIRGNYSINMSFRSSVSEITKIGW